MAVWEQKELIYEELPEEWHDPSLLPDFAEGIRRIVEHIDADDLVVVMGDKDADGVNGAAILSRILFDVGANVYPYVPTRAEGHGVQPKHVDQFSMLDCKLIVTVDNGSVAFGAMKLAQEYGIDMVITDHHNVSDKPNEYGFPIINPKRPDSAYPFRGICGATLALKVGQGILRHYGFPEDYWIQFIDFAAVATVGDVMPITGENRWIVKKGIEMLNRNPNVGYRQIVDEVPYMSPGNIDERTLGWTFAPMINSTGRIETPQIALDLLLNEDRADLTHFRKTEECNKKKREIMEEVMSNPEIQPKLFPIIWLHSDKIIEGLLGIVANKLGEKYQRPALCACPVSGGRIKGSGRSFGGYNLYEFLMGLPEEWFEARGGHAEALGFTLYQEYLQPFEEAVQKAVVELKEITHRFNRVVSLSEITEELMREIESKKPYGEGFPQPVFMTTDVTVSSIRAYSNAYYAKATQNDVTVPIAFDSAIKMAKETYDLLFTLERTKKKEVRLRVVDWRIVVKPEETTPETLPEANVSESDSILLDSSMDASNPDESFDPLAELVGGGVE